MSRLEMVPIAIAIAGAGGGGLLGALLARAGEQIAFVARGETLPFRKRSQPKDG